MEGQPLINYHDLRKLSPEKAREIIRKVLDNNGGNVSETARILGVSRATVRRGRDGELGDMSRKPLSSPNRTESRFEELLVKEGKHTGFRYRRLTSYMMRKYSLYLSENTVKAILKRNKVKKRTVRTANKNRRPLYDYENLIPFSELQLDTKHLLDKSALPLEVYEHMRRQGLPQYEWNMIDAATRLRFTAYSHELSATFGLMFIVLVTLWLRAHNVRVPMRIRMDNGGEFCRGSSKKLEEWNGYLSLLDVSLDPIQAGAKHLMALVENSHRADDEYFLMVHAERCNDTKTFLQKAQGWQDTWNCFKPHHGIEMNGLTPSEKLKTKDPMINAHILKFPVLLLEDVLKYAGLISSFLKLKLGGKYVYTNYQNGAIYLMLS